MVSEKVKFEREFFKLAGFMLLSRYQLIHCKQCTGVHGHSDNRDRVRFMQMSYLGYADSREEMILLCKEMKSGS